MRHAYRVWLVIVAVALAAGVASAQNPLIPLPSPIKYVAVGDSLTAGYASAGLAQMYQAHSFPEILATQFGMSGFQQPLISDPGIPAVLELKSLAVVHGSVVPTIAAKSGLGSPLNATYNGIYNNLGIPGAKAGDLLTKTGDITKLLSGHIDQNTIMYDLVLRFPLIPGTQIAGTAVNQAVAADGNFYTVWVGNNDVLGAALTGVVQDGVTLTPAVTFQTQYTQLVGTIKQQHPSAMIMLANVPDVTSIPFVTTVKPYLVNPANGSHIPLIGENGLLTEQDYVTLGASSLIAQGIGVPVAAGGTGIPLPEGKIDAQGLHPGVILRAAEVATIQTRTNEINSIIKNTSIVLLTPVVDINAIFKDILANGRTIGGVEVTASFLTGGIFSYDGVHPQSLGYALVANEFVKAINATFKPPLPLVNLRPFVLGASSGTSVMAAQAVFTLDATNALVKSFVPNALPLTVPTSYVVRRALTHRQSEPLDRGGPR